jgi:hypothetical protein
LQTYNKSDLLTFFVCFAILLLAFVFYAIQPLLSDVSYFVAADQRILGGAIPYRDILETNPPLAFWFTLPPVWLAGIMGLPAETVFVVYALAINAGVLFFVWHLHGSDSKNNYDRKELLIILTAVTCFGMSFGFGQREYFLTLLLLPYITSVASRVDGKTIHPYLQVLLGLITGVGLAFKPYFLAIPLLVEAFHLYETRNWKVVLRIDIFIMAGVMLVYPLLAWWQYPEYFSDILPMAQLTYEAYQISLHDLVWKSAFILFSIITIDIAVLVVMRGVRAHGYYVWLCAAFGGLLSYFAQAKGFPYHLVPALTFILTAFFLSVKDLPRPLLRWVSYVGFVLCVLYGLADYASQQKLRVAAYDELLNGAQPKRMMIFTSDIGMAFPFMPAHKIEWVGHFQSFWMMPAVSQGLISGAQAEVFVEKIGAMTGADLEKYRPDYVIIDNRKIAYALADRDVDFVSRFSLAPSFLRAWSSYKLANSKGRFQLWERK